MINRPAQARWTSETPAMLGSIAITLHERSSGDTSRLRRMVDDHWEATGRILRNLGVAASDVDDALQQVYVVASNKLASIEMGKERAFLAQVAVHMAARARRARGRNRETAAENAGEERADEGPSAEEAMDRERARVMLDRVLDGLGEDLREVFVLFEIQEMTMAEIAVLLDLRPGTVASRLRRAREEFEQAVARLEKRQKGGTP